MLQEVVLLAIRVIFLFLGIYQLIVNSQIYKDFVGEPATSYTISPTGTVINKGSTILKGKKDKVVVNGEEGDSPLSVTITTKSNYLFSSKQVAMGYLAETIQAKTSHGFTLFYGEDNDGIDFFMLSRDKSYPEKVYSSYTYGRTMTDVLSKFKPSLMQNNPA